MQNPCETQRTTWSIIEHITQKAFKAELAETEYARVTPELSEEKLYGLHTDKKVTVLPL